MVRGNIELRIIIREGQTIVQTKVIGREIRDSTESEDELKIATTNNYFNNK